MPQFTYIFPTVVPLRGSQCLLLANLLPWRGSYVYVWEQEHVWEVDKLSGRTTAPSRSRCISDLGCYCQTRSPKRLYQITLLATLDEGNPFPVTSPALLELAVFPCCHSEGIALPFKLRTAAVGRIFLCLLAVWSSPLVQFRPGSYHLSICFQLFRMGRTP